jgi:hypothetical protein
VPGLKCLLGVSSLNERGIFFGLTGGIRPCAGFISIIYTIDGNKTQTREASAKWMNNKATKKIRTIRENPVLSLATRCSSL